MIFQTLSVAAVLNLAAYAAGEQIAFYGGPQCQGTPEGVVSTKTTGQCFSVPENAESAVLAAQDYTDTTVQFWSNTDCTGTLEASGNDGCVSFVGLGANAQSYSLTSSFNRGRKVRRDQTEWWKDIAQQHRDVLGIAAENATGSLAPHWDPYAAVESGFGHGNVTELWGETYKWHQVALGVTIGIPVDEWDDDTHVLSDDFIPFGDADYDAMLAKRWEMVSATSQDEIQRRWNYAQCRGLLSCANKIAASSAATIGNGWAQTVRAGYKAKAYNSKFYDWAHKHPFSVGIATSAGSALAGYGLGKTGGGATAQDNTQLGQCANDSTQQNAFIQSLAVAASASSDNTAEVSITLPDGHILTIMAAVYPKGHAPPSNQRCGV